MLELEVSRMPTVTTSVKGQIVIPKKEREKIGIKPGLRVVVEAWNRLNTF
jgi:AbrB family looped-hinge helix DNA binding protein